MDKPAASKIPRIATRTVMGRRKAALTSHMCSEMIAGAALDSENEVRDEVQVKEPMMRINLSLLFVLVLIASCSKTSDSPLLGDAGAKAGEPRAQAPGFGEVMLQVGRRFELAGRAASANRFELAAFEVGELEELFENDMPRASLPKEGPTAQIPALTKAFLDSVPPELAKAATSKDQAAFAAAFQSAAAMCNACHESAAKGFIQVPSVPGQSVPVLDPLPAPSGSSR
jgi:cytochrome c553